MKNPTLLTTMLILALATAATAATPQANWDEHCAKCHGADGKGQTKMGKKLGIRDLTDAKTQAEVTDVQALDAMQKGITDKKGKTSMKAIEGVPADELAAMVPFVRALKK